jgi:D-alanyl-D-alanine carboxypeptidase (penicillin-binding protein 5/6)
MHVPALSLAPSVTASAPQTSQAVALNWPKYGQAAVGASNLGVLASHGSQTSVPMASTAKIMTALAVLNAKPLSPGQTATPVITLTQHDLDIYTSVVAKNGSVVLVAAGERMSEYQALQALLLPSANNMADSLAIWAFGSLHAYTTYANRLAAQLGLDGTHLADASGFSPATISTARNLVQLSLVAMKNPVFADIVGQSSAVIPVAGEIHNRNFLLGRDNIIGIKTGHTDQSGGVFVSAATHHVGGQTVTVIASVMGGPNISRAILDSVPLLASAEKNLAQRTVVKKGTSVGTYTVPWASKVSLKTTGDLKLIVWGGSSIVTTHKIETLHVTARASTPVGTAAATSGGVSTQVPVVTSSRITRPSFWWRMMHPNY